jgi:plastocyanin
MRYLRSVFLPAVLLCLLPGSGRAGEVTVNATTIGNNQFSPASININVADHVTWIWVTSGHTCTSGSTGVPAAVGPPGHQLQWGTSAQAAGAAFSLKFIGAAAGAYQYFCAPHFPTMQGVVNVGAAHQAVADFRISEVRYGAGANDFVEIANLGDAAGNLQGYRLNVGGSVVTFNAVDVLPGGRIVNQGAFTAALGSTGSVALFVPNTIDGTFNALSIIDYVQWGAAGQPLEQIAADAQPTAYWTPGDFLPTMAPGHSMSFCGVSGQYGMGFWSEVANPTPFNANDCASPAYRSTWGRLKSLYR